MKTFHKIDFYLQIVLFAGCALSLIFSFYGGLIFLFLLQFVVGSWQLFSGILNAAYNWKKDEGRLNIRYYWIAVFTWIVVAVLIFVSKGLLAVSFDAVGITWLILSWPLAIYYFLLTRKNAF